MSINRSATYYRLPPTGLRGQVYLIIVFALTFSAGIFFLLAVPLTEQARGLVVLSDSYQALASAESGLEVELYRQFYQTALNLTPPAEINYTIATTTRNITATGRGKFTERSLSLEQ